MFPIEWLFEAEPRIAPYIRVTPLTYDAEHELYLKWENRQVTGSFKARGAFNKVLALQPWERQRGLVTASAGNHGQGVALAGKGARTPVTIFASEHAVPAKVEAMRILGADVRMVAGGYGEAELAGLEYAARTGATWVSPYNDGQVIAGQGTLALEVLCQGVMYWGKETPQMTWLVPVGGGGLIAGTGVALKGSAGERTNQHRIIGVQSQASPFMHAIFHHGDQAGVVELPSLADGLSGPVESGSITIPLVRKFVDDLILVSEAEVEDAIALAWQHYQERIEGSAAVALAAALYHRARLGQGRLIVVISGGNIQPETHAAIMANSMQSDSGAMPSTPTT